MSVTESPAARIDENLLPPDGHTLLVDGQWRSAEATFDVVDPATLEVIGRPADAGPAEALAAFESTVAAYDGWRRTAAEEKAARLRDAIAEIRSKADELAYLMSVENGKPLYEARNEILRGAAMLEWGAEEARRVYGRVVPASANGRGLVVPSPVGPTLCITPWNFPASMLMRKIGLSLAAGAPLLSKPAEQTPLIACAVVKIIDSHLPPGVLTLVTTSRPGEVVDALLGDVRLRKVTFTGSTEVGIGLVRKPGQQLRRVSLEMGGHSPAIVFPDADVEDAIGKIMQTKFANAGQSCISINRLFVHERHYDRVVGELEDRISKLTVGYGLTEGTQIGPLIDFDGLAKVERHVDDAVKRGAAVRVGGRRWSSDDPDLRGAYYAPTLLTEVDTSMQIAHEETFGPVLPVYRFGDDVDIVARANDTNYGLAAYIFARDFNTIWDAVERLEFGVIGVNEAMPNRPELPFGGVKNSGLGREGGTEGIEDYIETKAVAING